MAESEIITTPARPTLRFKVFLMVSVPCSTRESSFEIGMANPRIHAQRVLTCHFKQTKDIFSCIFEDTCSRIPELRFLR